MATQGKRRPRMEWRTFVGLALAGLPLMTMAAGSGETPQFERVPLVIEGDHVLHVELARTPMERQHGLMDRDRLAADTGMLFLYQTQQSPQSGFWMHRTRIPLDIAFIAKNGAIRSIEHMVPCGNDVTTHCPTYRAGVPFRAALEVNAGYFESHGIEVGDHVGIERYLDSP
ncbi:DUF192 domain-containing protein [Halomonas sp. WWR20]